MQELMRELYTRLPFDEARGFVDAIERTGIEHESEILYHLNGYAYIRIKFEQGITEKQLNDALERSSIYGGN